MIQKTLLLLAVVCVASLPRVSEAMNGCGRCPTRRRPVCCEFQKLNGDTVKKFIRNECRCRGCRGGRVRSFDKCVTLRFSAAAQSAENDDGFGDEGEVIASGVHPDVVRAM